jgi:hypothetical protein
LARTSGTNLGLASPSIAKIYEPEDKIFQATEDFGVSKARSREPTTKTDGPEGLSLKALLKAGISPAIKTSK